MSPREPIAVVGLGCRFPGADSPAAFWRLLAEGVDAVGPVPADRPGLTVAGREGGFLADVATFTPRRFGLSAREAAAMDPQQRLVLEVAHDALDEAAIAPEALAGSATGVYMGVSSADYAQLTLGGGAPVDGFTNAGAAASVVANRLSYLLDLHGPSLVVDTACSSSLVAVHLACRDLWDGRTDLALAGGVNVILSPAVAAGFDAAGATSPDGRCKAFDARANGMVRGEGSGVVVLKRLADARRNGDRVHAVIHGGAVNQDGRTNGLTAPNRHGQEALLRSALADAGVGPEAVVAVETHGTGTPLGDPIEAAALGAVLGTGRAPERALRLGAVKTNLGHLEAAAGVAGLVKAVLAVERGAWPPSLHFETPSPHIPFDAWGLRVGTALEELPDGAVVGVSAFGFGGTNAHLLLSAIARLPSEMDGDGVGFLPISAKAPDVLVAHAAALHAHLTAHPDLDLAALARTAALRRTHHRFRRALPFTTRAELLDGLAATAALDPASLERAPARPPRVVFVFPGMGSQLVGMGRALLAEPAFRAAVEACDRAMRPYLDRPLLEEIDAADAERQARGDIAQPLVFALQVGLAALWASWGIRPDAVVGNSLGEIAAAHVAGALSLEEAARVVCTRARAMMTRAGHGTMAAVEATVEEAHELLAGRPAWVAAVNAPRQLLLAGERAELEAVIAMLEARGRFARLVKGTQVASHSPMVEPLREPLAAALGRVTASAPALPMISTVSGMALVDAPDEHYWWRNMREPVQLAGAIATVEATGPARYIELSAHPSVAPAIAANLAPGGTSVRAIGTLRRGRPEPVAAREALATVYAWGLAPAWEALVDATGPIEPLPPAPWPRERCWIDGGWQSRVVPAATPPEALPERVPAAVAAPASPATPRPAGSPALDRAGLLALPGGERRERLIAHLQGHVARVLGLAPAQVDVEEPLTSLGVGSLMGMELNNRLETELGARLPVARLLAGPNLTEIAEEVLAHLDGSNGAGPIPAGPPAPTAPLSLAQRRLYFLARLAPDASAYHIPGAVRLAGPLDVGALVRALETVVARHEALRTTFRPGEVPGEAVQAIAPTHAIDLPVVDLTGLPEAEREEEARAIAVEEARHPFDLAIGPLLRTTLVRLAKDEHWLLVTLHHLVADGWSLAVLLGDLAEAYAAARAGRPVRLAPLAIQYADFARWQQARADGPDMATQLAYWRERLADAPALASLPTDRPRPALQGFRGGVRGTILPGPLVAAVDAFARAHQATRFMVLYAAFTAWLARATGQADLVVGTPIAGRHHPGLEGLIGFFLNTLPLRLAVGDDPPFAALVERARATVLAAFEHQDVPFERLVEALARPERATGHAPVFQVMIALHAPMKGRRVADLALQPIEIDGGTAKYDLTAAFLETDDGLRCAFEYDADLFDAGRVEGWLGQFQTLLADAVAAPAAPVSRLALVSDDEAAGLVALGEGPALETAGAGWWQAILARAAASPGQPAVVDAEGTLTYGELVGRAGALAAHLAAAGAGPDAPVAVLVPRSGLMVAAWLAAFRAGAPYIPLDPTAPPARLARLLADARPAVLVTPDGDAPDGYAGTVLALRDLPAAPADGPPAPAAELAYIVYTSGTTGEPRGVAVPHAGLASLVAWHQGAYEVGPADRMAQVANPAFDAAGWEVWPALAAGATLQVAPADALAPARLVAWLAAMQTTLAFLPTPLCEEVLASPWPAGIALRALLTGGDRLTRRPPPDLPFRLFNHYGPTEASVVATAHEVAPTGDGLPPIGRPIANTRARVLDPHGRPVPVGLPGELWLGGNGLARGYWRDPALTAARFVTMPDGERLYRTGDRVRWRADCQGRLALEFLGRLDDQVQIRGVRVEPAEVTARLQAHPGVAEALVVARPDAAGAPTLVAYWAGAASVDELAAHARAHLPPAFVPAAWVRLEALPRTANGKLDRRALPAPPLTESRTGEPPRGATEERLAALWAELLVRPAVGRHDDFFALGGHSLLALRLVDRIAASFGVDPGLQALFAGPTVAELAARIDALASSDARPRPVLEPEPAAAHAPFALTDVQQAYWVGRLTGGVAAHAYLELEARDLDLEALRRAIDALVARHPQLRMVVDADGRQRVLPSVPPFAIAVHDLRALPGAEREAALASARTALDHEVRDASAWPLFGLAAARIDDRHTRLLLSFDALVADATSLGLLARELGVLLEGGNLPPIGLTFRDYARAVTAHDAGPHGDRARAYWRERLATLPPAPALPRASTAPAEPVRFERHAAGLSAGAWQAFTREAAARGVTPGAALVAVFSVVLARWSRAPRFTLNLTLFDRRPVHPDVDRLVGDFTALELLEVDAGGRPACGELARAVQRQLAMDLDHREAGGMAVLRELARLRGSDAAMPVVFTGVLDQDLDRALPAALGRPGFGLTQTPQVELDHQALLRDGALAYQWDVRAGVHAEGVVEAMFAAYGELLARLAADPAAWDAPAEALPGDVGAAIAAASDGGPGHPPGTLHGAFAAMARAHPHAVAVVAGETRLTYAALAHAAGALAARLASAGAGPLVAVACDKGWEAVVAVLGVLWSGRAYVPIEPALPRARRAGLVERTGARIVLAAPGPGPDWPDDVAVWPIEPMPADAAVAEAAGEPADLAYVIFTSGSTGEPKGVAVAHRAALNTVHEVNRRHGVGPTDRTFALSALGFDLSVYDLFGPLAVGGAVVLPPAGSARDPGAWLAAMAAGAVTIWNSVPALARMLLEWLAVPAERALPLRLALLSGDWVGVDLPGRLRGHWPALAVEALGGATEAAIWSIAQPVPPEATWPVIPYGRALAGQAMHVLDDDLRPRPPGVPGEIYIGGLGLARGYWADAGRTAERFVTGPDGSRLYRTGDWGRWIPGGDGGLVIEFLGREDDQVKVLGQRIELGEIEAALARLPGLRAAAVVAVGPRRGDKHLVGCVVADGAPDFAAVEAALAERLPAGMVPRAWVVLEALPLSANGKVDRAALAAAARAPAAEAARPQARAGADVAGIAALLADVLGRETLDPDADLLALGVNSIDLVRVANRLEAALGHRPDLADLFGLRTVRDLAAYYARQGAAPADAPAAGLLGVGALPGEAEAASPARVLLDPAAREAFKRTRPGLRASLPGEAIVSLGGPAPEALAPAFARRHSARTFAATPVALDALAALLADLRALEGPLGPKRRYGSAGGLYPVQVYLHVADGGVSGLAAGAYYHDPERHALVAIAPGATLPREVHFALNLPVADQARFTVFLVAKLGAIQPIYGDWARAFCLLEAGAMAQLLAERAPEAGLALCPVGHLDAGPVRAMLGLAADDAVCHALLGGVLAEAPAAALVVPGDAPKPLSSAQERLWFLDRLSPGDPTYHVSGAFHLAGPLDRQALQVALNGLVARHEVLRTCYPATGGRPHARVLPPRPVPLPVVDLTALPPDERTREAHALVAEDAREPFDLADGPVLRVLVVRLAAGEHLLGVTIHHIAADAWSCQLAVAELAVRYEASRAGQADPLPPLPLQYGDHARAQRAWLAGPAGDAALARWRERLAGAPTTLELPIDRPRPPVQTARGARHDFRIEPGLARGLAGVATPAGATAFMGLLAAYQALLARASGQDDVLVGTPVAGRERQDLEGLVGCFTNTLVLRGRFEDDPGFAALLARTREAVLAALADQAMPFERLVEALAPARDPSRTPLFQAAFVFQQPPRRRLEAGPLVLAVHEPAAETAKFDLTLAAWEEAEGFTARFEYNTDLFEAATIEALAGQLVTLLAAAVAAPETPISRLPLLAPEHEAALWGAPPAVLPVAPDLPARFLARAEARPDAIAVVHGAARASYGEVAARARGLAGALVAAGVRPGDLVAIDLPRGIDAVVAVIGTLLAGAAYLPLDHEHPAERRAAVFADARPAAVVGDAPGFAGPVLAPDASAPLDALPARGPADLAYVIYTSGSTGRPKGVEVTHANMTRLFEAAARVDLSADEHDVWTLFHSLAFDFSIWELWGALARGGRLVVVDAAIARTPDAFWDLVAREGVTVLNQTPGAFHALARAARDRAPAPALRLVIFGGDALEPAALAPWWQGPHGRGPRLVNMYGITETTVHVTHAPLAPEAAPGRGSPIGLPLPDLAVHLLDRHGRPVPPGHVGEIVVGGAGVTRGYRDRPALTAERFIDGPPGHGRLYRSGDLARRDATGRLWYLGRLDAQLKIRGHRIEPGEVEAALLAHPAVAAAAVMAVVHPGDRRLAAFYVPREPAPDAAALRAHLAARLPAPMVPATFAAVPALPLTANGKLDREALAAVATAPAARPYEAPRDALEREIAGAWAQLLGVAAVGRDDNFFDLGGHSLLLVQAQERLRALVGREVPLVTLFQHPTVAALAAHLAGEGAAAEPPAARPQLPADDAIAIVGLAGRFPGAPDVDALWALLRAGREGIRRHSAEALQAAGVSEALAADPRYVPAGGVLDGIEDFDAAFFGYAPAEAALLDPQHRLFLETAWQALEHAGVDPARPPGPIGLFAGAGASRYLPFHLAPRPELLERAGELGLLLATDKDYVVTRAAYALDLRGPVMAIQTACSTSLAAVHEACQALRAGECDLALAGGVAIETRQQAGYLHQPGGIGSPDGHCRAFDAEAAGTIGGSGVALVALRRLADALADGDTIHAVIRGSALTNDGADRVGFTAPGVAGQARAIAAALAAAGVPAESVGYVEAHGTGTPLGDPIEVAALNQAYGRGRGPGTIALGSLKSNIGHLDAAAGVAGLIKATLALRHAEIPASLHVQTPNPHIDFAAGPFYVNTALAPWPAGFAPRRAGVSSFGLGGTNVHAILEEPPPVPPRAPAGEAWHVFAVSARTPAALASMRERLAAHLAAHAATLVPHDVAHTLATGRRAFGHRAAVAARDLAEAARLLAGDVPALPPVSGEGRVAFLIPGLGAQYPGMGRTLYEQEPAYRAAVDECAELLAATLGRDLRELLFAERDPAVLARPTFMQPAIFATAYAAARLWQARGVRPVALLGHSLGEYVAACLAGVFTLGGALELVATRGRLFEAAEGALVAVAAGAASLSDALPAGVCVAADNGPGLCLLAGPAETLAAFEAELVGREIGCKRPRVPHATHHPMLAALAPELERAVARAHPRPPALPYFSNLTGDWIAPEQATDPAYWGRHLTAPVRFGAALARLGEDPSLVLLDIGPGQGAGAIARATPTTRAAVSAFALPGEDDAAAYARARAALWCAGVGPALAGPAGRRVPLPTYPFERRRHWIPPVDPSAHAAASPVRRPDPADWFAAPGWRQAPRLAPAALPSGPWLVVGDDGPRARAVVATLAENGAEIVRLDAQTLARGEDAVRAWLDGLAAVPPRALVLVGLDPRPDADDEALLRRGFDPIWILARAWARGTRRPARLDVVGAGLVQLDDREPVHPALAAIAGLVRCLPFEVPGLAAGCIDLGPDAGLDAEALGRELAGPGQPLVALRGRRRWLPEWTPVRLDGRGLAPRERGVYLLTGGTGGLGLALARHLASAYRARLVLVARHAVPAAVVAELEAAGAEVLAIAGDVAAPATVAKAVAAAHERFGALHGVLHLAGAPDAGLVAGNDLAAARAVLAPKLAGARALAAALAPLPTPPDFVVHFGALAAHLGGPGQAAYAAANAALEAFARDDGRTPVLTLVWGAWREVGLAARLAAAHGGAAAALQQAGMGTGEAIAAFERALAGGESRLAISPVAPAALARLAAAALATTPAPVVRPADAGGAPPEGALERAIAASWEAHLGVGPIGRHEGFLALGGHSLMAIGVAAGLERTLGRPVPLGPMLAGGSVADLAAALAEGTAAVGPAGDPLAVPLRAGDGPPLVLVHAVGGTLGGYRALIDRLPPGRAVWGLQAPALAGEPMPADLAGLAARHLAALRAIQPHGPYWLAGWSLGGVVALELARLLRAAGEPVARVMMLDSALPDVTGLPDPADEPAHVALFLADLAAGVGAVDGAASTPTADLTAAVAAWQAAGRMPAGIAAADLAAPYAAFRGMVAAARGYRPAAIDVPVAVVGARDGLLAADPAGPWRTVVPAAQLEAIATDGDHHGLLHPPHVDAVAAIVAALVP